MALMKTPGAYLVEKNAFPNSVVEVATAVPAFVGHTEVADNMGKSLAGKPWRISSVAEYQLYFGVGPTPLFDIVLKFGSPLDTAFTAGGKDYVLTRPDGKAGGRYLLYYSILHFYENGGGPCYIVSVGDYKTDVGSDLLQEGVESLAREQEMVWTPPTR